MNNLSNQACKLNAGIIGADGYSGQALVKILGKHPNIKTLSLFTRQQASALAHDAANIQLIPLELFSDHCPSLDIVFLATPAEASMSLAKIALSANVPVIDLSGAFRLNAEQFEQWYQHQHTASEYIQEAIYGLTPYADEFSAKADQATLIANPGCYANCTQMALLPLLKNSLIDPTSIIVDAKSGVSGAGKKPNQNLMFAELCENFYPYRINSHQHQPEITHHVEQFTDIKPTLIFNTQLLPIKRGLAISLYAKLNSTVKTEHIEAAYYKSYSNYPFVKFCSSDQTKQASQLLALSQVVHTPNTHIVFSKQSGWVTVFACIDNLLKGAASQAVENFNKLFHFPLTTGLLPL